jgi:hypothetical protein
MGEICGYSQLMVGHKFEASGLGRHSRFGGRVGVTVRFRVAGVTSLRRALAMKFALLRNLLLVQDTFFEQSRPSLASAGSIADPVAASGTAVSDS